MIGKPGDTLVEIHWIANPFRAEKLREAMLPAAELVLEYGATGWAFIRSKEDPQHFIQLGLFASTTDFERYWYSDEMSELRVNATGLFQVPILPVWLTVEGNGAIVPEEVEAS
ncbi:MAG TPA: hypothetical protein VGI67_03120 [Thermoleophilaceae bacterium]|jgi:hypothetical protein